MKRIENYLYDILDFVTAFVLICLSLPLFIAAVFLVKIDSPGPVFYKQERYGKNKKTFWIYKLRTMKVGAENGRPIWGNEADPRASRIGKFLRTSHIDELPQLFNVMKGDMSVIGPRPERPYFAERFKISIPYYEERYRVKPGITGWSQINGLRGDSSIEERTDYDIFYIDNRSLFFNLKILLLTPFTKPIRKNESAAENDYFHSLTFSHKGEEALDANNPLAVPIRNA